MIAQIGGQARPIPYELTLKYLTESEAYKVMDRWLARARTCQATNDRDGLAVAEQRLDQCWAELDRRARLRAEADEWHAAHDAGPGR